MAKQEKKEILSKLKSKKWLRTAVIFVALYTIAWFIPPTSSFVKYPVYFVKCGGRPIIASNYSGSYYLPGDIGYGVGIFSEEFYCTETEAQAAHYRRTELRFPE